MKTQQLQIILLLSMASTAMGTTYYVNNKIGNDANDGLSEAKAFATFARTVRACKTSDAISIACTGTAYRVQLNMANLGGTPAKPFIIEGNGAVVNGFREITAGEWRKVSEHLYYIGIDIGRLGAVYYFLCDGKRIRNARKTKVEDLAAGELLQVRGGFYFRCADGKTIADYPFSGLTFINPCINFRNSSYVICRNVITEYSADDGIAGSGECRGLYLENIECRYNGDQGISFHDVCEVTVRNAWIHHNGTGIVDVNASRTYYNGVLCEDNEGGCGFNGGYHSMVDSVIRNNGRSQLAIRALRIKHLPGCENSPVENTTVFLKNVILSDASHSARGVVLEMEGVKNQLIMEHCVIEGCQTAIWALMRKESDDSFLHMTASAIANCGTMILNDHRTSKFRFYGDYNVYCPAGVNWLGKNYAPTALETFLQANGSDKNSRIGVLSVKGDGRLVDESGALLTGKLQSVGPTYFFLQGRAKGAFENR